MGKGLERLTPEELQQIKNQNIFDEPQIAQHLKRYAKYDTSKKGTEGIIASVILLFPEFSGHPFIERILEIYMDDNSLLFPEPFVSMCAALSSMANVKTKYELAFNCFDIHENGVLKYESVYNMYKMLFKSGSLTEEQILDLTFRALSLSELQQTGEITIQDFKNVVSNGEIKSKFTVDLQLV